MLLAMIVTALGFTACGDDEEEDCGNGSSFLIGTWQSVDAEGYGYEFEDNEDELEFYQFKADGTYIGIIDDEDGIDISRGTWKLTDNELVLRIKDGELAGSSFSYTILERKADRMVVSMWGITATLRKVSDSKIEKYIGNGNNNDKPNNDNYETSLSLSLERGGTLSSQVSKSQASQLLKLKLSGHMDARDFDYIKWDCMNIEEIDLSEVVIDSYYGVEGTQEGENVGYAANEIPSGAFFYWKNVHKYIYDGMPIDEGMASLKKVILPKGIKAIRRNAFARAYNIKKMEIPEGVEAIDLVAFNICTSLEELYLPSTLKTVGQWAFGSLKSLKKAYFPSMTPPSIPSNAFDGLASGAVLYVPRGTESKYRESPGWNTFTQIEGITNL